MTDSVEGRSARPGDIWDALVQDPGTGVIILDRDGRILYANDAIDARLDPSQPVVGRTLDAFHPGLWTEERLAVIRRVIEEQRPLMTRAIWDGRQIVNTVRPIRADDGDETHAVHALVISRARPGEVADADEGRPLELVEFEAINLGPLDALSPRELEVLALLGQGLAIKEIAALLHRSPRTIEKHKDAVARKLHESDRVRLARIALEAGLTVSDVERERVAR